MTHHEERPRTMRLAPVPSGIAAVDPPAGVAYRTAADARRTVSFVGRDILEITGRHAETYMTGRLGLMDVVHAEDRAGLRAALADIVRSPAVLDHRYRLLDARGGVRWVHDVATPSHVGGVLCLDGTLTDRTERDAEPEWEALHDPLTGLANRTALQDRLALELSRLSPGTRTCLLMVAVDDLSGINHTTGHEAGDRVLVECARRLQAGVRGIDLCARPAPATFAVLLVDTALAAAVDIAGRLRDDVASSPVDDLRVTVGVGAAQSWGNATPADMLELAGNALRRAKALGRGAVVAAPAVDPGPGDSAA